MVDPNPDLPLWGSLGWLVLFYVLPFAVLTCAVLVVLGALYSSRGQAQSKYYFRRARKVGLATAVIGALGYGLTVLGG